MKDLDKNEVYDLRGISEEQAKRLLNWLLTNDIGWSTSHLEDLMIEKSISFSGHEWSCDYIGRLEPTIHISTLLEEKSLEEQLKEAETKVEELKKQIEDRDKPKIGDVCKFVDFDENGFIIDILEQFNSTDSEYKYKAKNKQNYWMEVEKVTKEQVMDLLFNNK